MYEAMIAAFGAISASMLIMFLKLSGAGIAMFLRRHDQVAQKIIILYLALYLFSLSTGDKATDAAWLLRCVEREAITIFLLFYFCGPASPMRNAMASILIACIFIDLIDYVDFICDTDFIRDKYTLTIRVLAALEIGVLLRVRSNYADGRDYKNYKRRATDFYRSGSKAIAGICR